MRGAWIPGLLFAAALSGQSNGVTTAVVPPQYSGVQTRVGGVFVTPIPNLPMSATVDISSMRVLPDGSTELRKTENHIARGSSGRIYNERRTMVPVTYKGTPRLLGSRVYDPGTRVSMDWTPFSNVVESRILPERALAERKPFTVPQPGTTDEDLGTSTMSGVSVHGLRRTRVLGAKTGPEPQPSGPAESGTTKPITITDEYWYSEDLHLVMLEKHDDPRTGEQIVTVLDVNRAEPDAHIFDVPQNYRIVDLTPTGPGTAAAAKTTTAPVSVVTVR